jgi:hypothetical protein
MTDLDLGNLFKLAGGSGGTVGIQLHADDAGNRPPIRSAGSENPRDELPVAAARIEDRRIASGRSAPEKLADHQVYDGWWSGNEALHDATIPGVQGELE